MLFLNCNAISYIKAALSLLVRFYYGLMVCLIAFVSGIAEFKFKFIRLRLMFILFLPLESDRGVEVLVCFILLIGVIQSELVGLLFRPLREVVEDINESRLCDLGSSSTIDRLR